MGYVLHLGHNPADLGLAASYLNTTAAGFDANYDVNCIRFYGDLSGAYPFAITHDAPQSDDLWVSFRFMVTSFGTSSASRFMHFYDANGNEIASIQRGTTAYFTISAIGDTTVTTTTSATLGAGVASWFDVKVTVSGGSITISLYQGGVLTGTATAANTGGKGKPAVTQWENYKMIGSSNSSNYSMYFAHIAILDGVSTINRRFARRTPAAVGTYAQMTGAVSALADADMASRVTSNTAGQRESFSLSGPTGVSGSSIAAVHVVQSAQRGSGAPSKSGGFLRIGGANYDATPETAQLDAPRKITSTWETNPVDNSVWTTATVPTEVGILSAT